MPAQRRITEKDKVRRHPNDLRKGHIGILWCDQKKCWLSLGNVCVYSRREAKKLLDTFYEIHEHSMRVFLARGIAR